LLIDSIAGSGWLIAITTGKYYIHIINSEKLIELKQKLYNLCVDYVNQRISTAQNAIDSAQTSANEEIKSSAGDKYETSRSLMQQEAQWGRTQLEEAQKLKQDLDQIIVIPSAVIQSGSLVFTNKGIFYIAISAGRLSIDGETIFAISALSPLGIKLMGQEKGARFDLNGQVFNILEFA
jgi:hypothetical protein